jgi:putative inorganic carbon (HCO3(-)) transporter
MPLPMVPTPSFFHANSKFSVIMAIDWGPWLALPWVAAFIVFSWLPGSYNRFVAWPWILIWELGWLALVAGGLWQLRRFNQPFRTLGYGLDWIVLALAAGMAISSLWSAFPQVALWNTSLAITYGIGLYVYRNWLTPIGTRYYLWGLLVFTAAVSALVSLAMWQPNAAMWQSASFYDAIRNHQPLGHHNFVGGYFALALPLAVAGAIALYRQDIVQDQFPQGKQNWLSSAVQTLTLVIVSIPVGLVALALYASGSRGAVLGCVGWLLITWTWMLVRTKGRQRRRYSFLGLAGIVLGAAILATNPRIRTWFSPLIDQGSLTWTVQDAPTLDRWFMMRLGAHMLRDHPLFGVGPGVMSRVSNLYRPIEAGAGLDHIQQLHNTPMQLAGELGLVGLALSLVGILCLVRLSWQIWQQPLDRCDRTLLGGIIGSFIAYGIASLTDYQLENIPIAGTLLMLVLLLVDLADHNQPSFLISPSILCQRLRRILSLCLWGWLGILICIWLPFTLAIRFNNLAAHSLQTQQFAKAHHYWNKASLLNPWDPTAAALASQHLYNLSAMMGQSSFKDEMEMLMLAFAYKAQTAAPNDVWFNQNLAVMLARQPETALPFATQAVQLLPRNTNYAYCLLGQILLALNQSEPATIAFTQEALVNPEILTSPLWEDAPFNSIYDDVLTLTLTEYEQLLGHLPMTNRGYAALQANQALLTWWSGQSLNPSQVAQLPLTAKTLVLAEAQPQLALQTIETLIVANQAPAPLCLLAAWLNPDTYWPIYANHPNALPEPELTRVKQSLTQRNLRRWLSSVSNSPTPTWRASVAFAYRNAQAQKITQILKPPKLEISTLVKELGLFQDWPREFPALDHRIQQLSDFIPSTYEPS